MIFVGTRVNNVQSLESVTIPDSVGWIDDRAFEACKGLTSVTMGNSVTAIGPYAFHNCDKLHPIPSPAGGNKWENPTPNWFY